MTTVEVVPPGPVQSTIRPPGSKSISNRALVCAAVASGTTRLTGLLSSEDTHVMLEGLRQIGVPVRLNDDQTVVEIDGLGGQRPGQGADLFVANSGTTVRFLVALLSALGGEYRLHGVQRMHQRPIADLLKAIDQAGGGAISENGDGCPPVRIDSDGWSGGSIAVAGNVSSQYLSGLLMAAPLSRGRLEIQVTGELVSRPYVDITTAVMRSFGVTVQQPSDDRFVIENAEYRGSDYAIEPDASAASYFWAAAAVTGGTIKVEGLTREALQGDVGFCQCLEQMGCAVSYQSDGITVSGGSLRGIDVNMNSISDTVQTLASVALFADGPTRVRDVAHNRYKETDRIGDLATELRKLGAQIEEHEDGLSIVPGPLHGATLETYNDHRMAMSFAVAGLRQPGIRILNPSCTGKTYPHFFADLQAITGQSHRWRSDA